MTVRVTTKQAEKILKNAATRKPRQHLEPLRGGWTCGTCTQYLRSWSAAQTHIDQQHGSGRLTWTDAAPSMACSSAPPAPSGPSG